MPISIYLFLIIINIINYSNMIINCILAHG